MRVSTILLILSCFFMAAYGELMGAASSLSNDDQKVLSLLEKHINRLNTNADGKLKLKETISIKSQVVAGMNYKVKGKFTQGSNELSCEVTMWQRVWMDDDDALIISADCDNGASYK